jgi:hypothetical protein
VTNEPLAHLRIVECAMGIAAYAVVVALAAPDATGDNDEVLGGLPGCRRTSWPG